MSHRPEQMQQQIHRIVGEFLVKESQNFGIGMVSINDILVSRDLSRAKILVSFIAEPNQQQAFDKLLRHGKAIQTHLFKQLSIKKVPTITWILDKQPELSYRIDEILDAIKSTDRKNSELPPTGSAGGEDFDSFSS